MAGRGKDLDILLVGKTGNGKSATGNSITGRKSFKSVSSLGSVTEIAQFEYSEFEGRILKVVDTPGIGDTNKNEKDGFDLVVKAVNQAMVANPPGYHTILILVKFGDRFSNEDVQTLQILKKIFGEGFIRNHGILVFTHGDHFKKNKEVKEKKITFEQWIQEQRYLPTFNALVDECENRVIIFNNNPKTEEDRVRQLRQLIEKIDALTLDNLRYTNEKFLEAEKDRQEMYDDLERPMLKEMIIKETSLINQRLGRLTGNIPENNHDDVLDELRKMKNEVRQLHDSVVKQDKGTGALKDGMKTLTRLETSIEDEIKLIIYLKTSSEKVNEIQKRVEKLMLEQQQNEARKKKEEELERRTKELEARKRAEELAEMERREEKEEIMKRKEELLRIKEENLKAAEQLKIKNEQNEKEYQELKEKESKGLVGRCLNYVGDTASAVWITFFGKSN